MCEYFIFVYEESPENAFNFTLDFKTKHGGRIAPVTKRNVVHRHQTPTKGETRLKKKKEKEQKIYLAFDLAIVHSFWVGIFSVDFILNY